MNVSIESRELKHLEIISDSEFCDPSYNMAKIIRLSTPKLISFICSAYMVQEYCLENLSSLVTATIQMTNEGNWLEGVDLELSVEEQKELYPKRMVEYLRGLHNVKELTVSSPDFVQVLGRSSILIAVQSSPQFCNLRCLKLQAPFTRCCLRGMTYLLKTSPSVEYLFLTRLESGLLDIDADGELGLALPCPMFHLKHVEIRDVQGCENEHKFLEFLLKNAIVLGKLVMSFDTTASANRRKLMKKFKEKLRTLPRASLSLTTIFL
ncbi:hypothetical protein MKW98_003702 [Papaver atlanticum]|uniref:FBD domain-containing protein n=1 Tax=Papaver atlanticum TaxID=357466 RepID=A0AAD4SIV6_9MAGN|nr:hypothetical protein MKW98_003702 [Papaver atlanticum]